MEMVKMKQKCVPKNPNCEDCIFSSSCGALQQKRVAKLPVKSKKTKVSNKFFNYLGGKKATVCQHLY